MSDKPVIFISHSSKDGELVSALKQQMENCFDSRVEVFASTIEPGENWFLKVMEKLSQADAIVTLITPNSVKESHWVWFELGYFWAKHDESLTSSNGKEKIYYPVYWNVAPKEWPNPVQDLQIQAAKMNDRDSLLALFERLSRQFGDGNTDQIDTNVIVEIINASKHLSVASDLTDEISAKEILRDYLKYDYQPGIWITYKVLDNQKMLFEGAAKSLLKLLVEEDDKIKLIVDAETENGIRFKKPPVNWKVEVGAQSYIGR